jgi:malate dehydrogenase
MTKGVKVCAIGAAGGIGQPLALLLKLTAEIRELSLVDISTCNNPIKGVATDLSHINSSTQVKGFWSESELGPALAGSDVVIITAGCMVLKPGMSRESLFDSSAGLIVNFAEACAKHCPRALIAIVTNPVNSMVPIFVEVLKRNGVESPERRVFGVTTLDVVRASTFVAAATGLDPKTVDVPVVGGHGGESILALLSQVRPQLSLNAEQMQAIEKRVNTAAFEVVDAKNGAGSATLSMAYAAARFVKALSQAVMSSASVNEYAYVSLAGFDVAGLSAADSFFACHCIITASGVMGVDPLFSSSLTDHESRRLEETRLKCRSDVEKANEFLRKH